ncbi:MAG: response regulator [Rhodospirillales bacterium]|nr:response regulator [Rhodospirillales bacterium]MSP80786.1 response regulator [Rhodospirillales bacterium]
MRQDKDRIITAPGTLQEKLAKLKAGFAEALPARLAEIAAAHAALAGFHGSGQAAALKALVGHAHKLAGSAATFGFPEVGNASRALDVHGAGLLKSSAPLDPGSLDRIAELVARIVPFSPGVPVAAPARKNLAATPETKEGPPSAIRGTVLYIEDNPDNLKLVEIVCEQVEGLTLLSADNAVLGLSLAAERKPDVVLMDINMPGMNGYEALERLRGNAITRAIPVIALSASATAHDIEKGEKAGFYRYLTKPVDLDRLLGCIQEAMERRP